MEPVPLLLEAVMEVEGCRLSRMCAESRVKRAC